jgi:ubiquinone/menaquinone biosynthesis C-methylase UbiE
LETDILKEKSRYAKATQDKKNYEPLNQNIIPVWGDIEEIEGTRLRDDSIDNILISNVFYLLKHKKTAILEMKRVLKKFGKILFIDWHKHLGSSTLHKERVLNEKDITNMFTEVGFVVHPRVHKDEHHFVLLIEKR